MATRSATVADNEEAPTAEVDHGALENGEPQIGIRRSNTRHSILSTHASELLQTFRRGVHTIIAVRQFKRMGLGDKVKTLAGYPRYAAVLSSDDRWMIFRRFNWLQARLILEKQEQLRLLELDLNDVDYNDALDDRKRITRARPNRAEAEARAELMRRLETTYKEYSDLLCAVQRMAAFERPEPYELNGIRRWVDQTKELVAPESEWINASDNDLVSMRGPREHAKLSAILEKMYNLIRHRLFMHNTENADMVQEALRKKDIPVALQQAENVSEGVQSWLQGNQVAEYWTGKAVGTFLLVLIPLMFVLPIYALSVVKNSLWKSILVLLAFALAFTMLVEVGTPARPHEVLGTSAAYLAVLVVFFGSVNQ